MKKVIRILIIILCVTISLTGITFAYIKIYNTFIVKKSKVETSGLYDDGIGHMDYEEDLMANDMTWQDDVRLYYRIITDPNDYQIYKSRIESFPEISEINFNKNFIVIIANENVRDIDEIDMEILDVYVEEDTINITMKQRENPNMNDTANVWYAIIDNSQLRDRAMITIEHKKFIHDDVKEFSELPKDYSVNEAIEDGCFVLENNKVVSLNKNQLDEFMQKTKSGESSFLRVYSKYDEEIIIKDVNFEDGMYYIDEIVLNNGKKYHNVYKKLKKNEKRQV